MAVPRPEAVAVALEAAVSKRLQQRSSQWLTQRNARQDKPIERGRLRKSGKRLPGAPCRRNRLRREKPLPAKRRPEKNKQRESFKPSEVQVGISGTKLGLSEKPAKRSFKKLKEDPARRRRK